MFLVERVELGDDGIVVEIFIGSGVGGGSSG